MISVLDRASLDGIENVGDFYTNNDYLCPHLTIKEYQCSNVILGGSNFLVLKHPCQVEKVSQIFLSQFL